MSKKQEWLTLPLIHSLDLQPDSGGQAADVSLEALENLLATRWEKEWLQRQLRRQEARVFLGEELRGKLDFLEAPDGAAEAEQETASLRWFALVRQAQRQGLGLQLCWRDKQGLEKEGPGWPLALEYYCSRREWYVHWWSDRPYWKYALIPLRQLCGAEILDRALPDEVAAAFEQEKEQRHQEVLLRLPRQYAEEQWRLLCALSCFDKQLEAQEDGTPLVRLWYIADDYRYLLMRLRLLGRRIEVLEPAKVREDLLAEARLALSRYQGAGAAGGEA